MSCSETVNTYHGWFTKQGGGNSGYKNWRKRYFVLEETGVFKYYKDKEMQKFRGEGNLAFCTGYKILENLTVKFKVPSEQRRCGYWLIKFHTELDRDHWIDIADKRQIKVLLLGMGGIGKTCLTNVYLFGEEGYTNAYDPTIEDCYRKCINVDGKDSWVDIVDLAGQEDYDMLQDMHIRDATAILLCYSIHEMNSLDIVKSHVDKILMIREELNYDITEFPLVLVATKCDMVGNDRFLSEHGLQYAEQLGCPYIETSAKLNINVQETFTEAIRSVRNPAYVSFKTFDHSTGHTSPQVMD